MKAYKNRSSQFKKLFRDVEDSISDFTVLDVFVQNVDNCEPQLNQIKNKFITLRSSLREFYEEFDSEQHSDREQQWEEKLNTLASKYQQNKRDIQAKIQEIKPKEAETAARNLSRSGSVASHNSSSEGTFNDTASVARAEIERKDLIDCLNDLQSKISSVRDC